jgi:hypothetical protein
MNRLFGIFVVIMLVAGIVAGFWYLNPRHLPSFVRGQGASIPLPAERSPMRDFKPPQF